MTLHGNLFYNCWIALAAFTVHFCIAIQDVYASPRILFGSFATAIVAFVATYGLRYLITYVLYTPAEQKLEVAEEQLQPHEATAQTSKSSTIEFQDESSEDIAEVVRTMMHSEESAQTN